MLSGIATSNTAANGSCSTPMGDKHRGQHDTAIRSRRLTSGIIIRNTTDISRPTATQDTPAKIRRSASISPKR